MIKFMITIGVVLSCQGAFSEAEPKLPPSCEKIKSACEKAGFAVGQGKVGKGLTSHCLSPLLNGTKAEGVLPLPKVSTQDIDSCKKEGPNFFGKITKGKTG